MIMFHGGCYGCTNQDVFGKSYCVGCQYLHANWKLPDLHSKNVHQDTFEIEIIKLKLKHNKSLDRTEAHWVLEKLNSI